jgi:hypothetical protein
MFCNVSIYFVNPLLTEQKRAANSNTTFVIIFAK